MLIMEKPLWLTNCSGNLVSLGKTKPLMNGRWILWTRNVERGITIKAKNTSVRWKDYLINVVDTPGHADFGGEVERVMKMVDGVMLVVDSHEGPQAQTRFVLQKALSAGLLPVVFVNKIDRPNAQPAKMQDLVLELFWNWTPRTNSLMHPFFLEVPKKDLPRNQWSPKVGT